MNHVPCPADPTCDAPWTEPGQLAAHLMIDHLWASGKALAESRMLFGVTPASAEPPTPAAASEPFDLAAHRRAQKPPRPHAPKESDQPSALKEPPMSPYRIGKTPMAEKTCGACRKKGHRSDHCPEDKPAAARDGKPAPAKAAPTCGYCHRPAGSHSKGCKKRDGCKFCAKVAPKKCKHHSGEPGPKGPRSETLANPNVLGVSYLTRIKAAIAEHERKATTLREALAILES